MQKLYFPFMLLLMTQLSACGGGSSSSAGSDGAPTLSNKCQINQLAPSITSGSVTKANGSLSTSFILNLSEPTSIDITSNFENSSADDWIEGYSYKRQLTQGTHAIQLQYNLNSPSKNITDRYTKLNVTVRLPNNEACVANRSTNITLIQ